MSVAFNYRVTDGSANEYVINSCFPVAAEKGVPRSFCYAGGGSNKEDTIAERFKEDSAKIEIGINLATLAVLSSTACAVLSFWHP